MTEENKKTLKFAGWVAAAGIFLGPIGWIGHALIVAFFTFIFIGARTLCKRKRKVEAGGNPIGGKVPANIIMGLDDIDGLAFPNDDLPTTAPDLSLFENKLFRIMYGDNVTSAGTFGAARAYGKVTSITAIPEPGVLGLMGVFGGGLWVVRRRFPSV